MVGNERRNLTIKKRSIRIVMHLRAFMILLFAFWGGFMIVTRRILEFNFSEKVEAIILAGVIFLCLVLSLIDMLYSRKKCRCPYCGRPWSMLKHSKFRRSPLDLLNNSHEYHCYNCNEEVEIV